MAGTRVPNPYVQIKGRDGGIDPHAGEALAQNFEDLFQQILNLEERLTWAEEAQPWTPVLAPNSFFSNSWVNYTGNEHRHAQYRQVRDEVEMRGLISSGTDSTTAITLPDQYAPAADPGRYLFGTDRSSNTHGRSDYAETTGTLTPRGSNPYHSLDGIRFSLAARGTEGWTAPTFTNSWVNFGSPWAQAEYRKVGDEVQLRGLISTGTIGTSAFTLPTGYRPALGVHFGTDTSSNAHGQVRIDTNGNVVPSNGSNAYISLNGLFFSVAPPGTAGWKPLDMAAAGNGWINVDNTLWLPAEYRKRGDVVELRGLVTGGAASASLEIATLPYGHRPSARQIWCTTATGAHGRLDVRSDGLVLPVAGATMTYFSLSGKRFSTLP